MIENELSNIILDNTPATLSPASVGDAHNWRVFFVRNMRYEKTSLSFDEQLELLGVRGLIVDDPARARLWLSKISYYRLSAYFLPFKDGERFMDGTNFDQIAGLYIFDRKIRLLILDAIERIEVAVRTAITYEIAHAYGPFGHTVAENFDPGFDHARLLEEIEVEERRARETFVSHFRRKYKSEEHLPVWMATELLSFGAISKLYKAMSPELKKRVAADFGVDSRFLASWLHCLSYIRNVCAHHKRLWNRELAVKPALPSRSRSWPHQVPDNGRLYCILVVIRHMLRVVSPNCRWRDRLFTLMEQHADVPLEVMKIPNERRDRAVWR